MSVADGPKLVTFHWDRWHEPRPPRLAPRALLLAVFCLLLAHPQPGHAEWIASGVPVCTAPGSQGNAMVCSDGEDGAFVVWQDVRNGSFDLYLQRLRMDGTIAAGWPENGIPVCIAPESQYNMDIAADGTGGAFVAWEDSRDTYTNNHSHDIYLQRILGTGMLAPGWPLDGVAVCQADERQEFPSMTADGRGGVLVAWEDFRNGNSWDRINRDIYVQRFTGSGVAAPGWPLDGLPVCTNDSTQAGPAIVSDGDGGAILAWVDVRNGDVDIYVHRISGTGAAADGWTADGVPLCTVAGEQIRPRICSDAAGGAFVTWVDFRTQPPDRFELPYADLYVQRVTAAGSRAEGWPAEGVPVCTAVDAQYAHKIAADGFGGALVVWTDYRGADADIYATRITASGARAPGWSLDGTPVSSAEGYQYLSTLAMDGKGGAFFAFDGPMNADKLYAQHLDGAGQVVSGWPEAGVPLAPTPSGLQQYPAMVAAGSGAIVAWEDGRNAPGPQGRDIFAQRVLDNVVVAAAISLVSAVAEPERVVLAWWSAAANEIQPVLERRSMSGDWQRLGAPEADGSGNLRYEDRAVSPGERYGYRLAYRQEGRDYLTAEAWVQVPAGNALELEGFRPNPARGDLEIAFALPVAGAALLEVLDAGGRRVFVQESSSLGPGSHLVRFRAQDLRPGVYWIRLRQGDTSRVTRGILLR